MKRYVAALALSALGLLAQTASRAGVAVISHRGEHLQHPENTLAAYRAAFEAGADFFETDVRTTSDGRLAIMHDATVDRCTNGHGSVASMTFDQIRALDVKGEKIPTFDEVLEFARGRIGVYIDAKQVSAQDLVAAVRKYGMEDRVVLYGSPDLQRAVHSLEPRIKMMAEAVSLENTTRLIRELRPPLFAFDARDFQDEIIAAVKAAKAGIFVDRLGPADNPQSWEDAIRKGATGIQTDHPAELVRFLRSR